MKKYAVTAMLVLSAVSTISVVAQADKSTAENARDFAEKQAYSQSIGRAAGTAIGTVAGGAVGKVAGGVIGGVLAPTKTVDQATEMRHRDQAIRESRSNSRVAK